MRHIFILNPNAGKRDQTSRILDMADQLRNQHGLSCSCLLTTHPGSAEEQARHASESGEPVRIYACGGDGTVNEVANGIAGYDNAAMTAIPIGTGNDFLKNFGDVTLFQDAQNLWDGPVQKLDLIDCNGRYALTIACCGLDARIADDVHQYSGLPFLRGQGSYVASLLVNFLGKGIARRWTVIVDGHPMTDEFALVSVCNGRYYGGGFMPVPTARMNDGRLEMIMVRKVSRLKFARFVGDYAKGRADRFPDYITIRPVKTVQIVSPDEPLTLCLDGEILRTQRAVLKLADVKVNFFGPPGADPNATVKPERSGAISARFATP